MWTGANRRQFLRVETDVEVAFGPADGREQRRLRTLDLSTGGMAVHLEDPPEVGDELEVTLHLHSDPEPIVTTARIAHHQDSEAGTVIGVEFLGLPDADAERLDRFVDDLAMHVMWVLRGKADALLHAGSVLENAADLETALRRILENACRVLEAEASSVLLYDAERDRLRFTVALGETGDVLMNERFDLEPGEGIAGRAAAERSIQNVADVREESGWYADVDRATGFRTRSLLAVPLVRNDRLVGVLEVLNPRNKPAFDAEDEAFARIFSQYAGLAVLNARAQEEAVQGRRLDQELALAGRIQQGFLPDRGPDLPGWDIAGRNVPCRPVGGDGFDWIARPDGRCGVLIADVSGQGLGPSLLMSNFHAAVRASAMSRDEPDVLLASVNDMITVENPECMFITCWYGEIDPKTGAVDFVNAGHEAPLVVRADGAVERPGDSNLLVGVDPGVIYERHSIVLDPGDVLVLYTDGITEHHSPAGDLYGRGRLEETVAAAAGDPASRVVETVLADVERWGDGEPGDDMTVVVVRRRADG